MATTKKQNEYDTSTDTGSQKLTASEARGMVEQAMAGAQYTPSQSVTDAANALRQWQQNRPAQYQSAYQGRIDSLLDQILTRENFQYSYTQDPLYQQYAQAYTQNARNASADAAAQASALTGGYGSSYAVSAAQQAYQQQIGALSSAIPTLYSLALDTYNSEGDAMLDRLEQLNSQEQSAQSRYERELSDYYTQLEQMGEAYNTAYQQDYNQYLNYLNRLDTLRNYYSQVEQAQNAQNQQTFNNVMSVLGLIGDAVQLAITGTTGLGSLAGSLLNTGYNIYSGNRQYEAERADAAWSQQLQEKQYQDSLTQQQYKNTTAERQYQDALAQQKFDNDITSQKLAIAKSELALKQSQAAQKAASASAAAAAKTSASSSGSASGTNKVLSAGSTGVVPYTAARLRSLGRSDSEIRTALLADGYSSAQVREILDKLNS